MNDHSFIIKKIFVFKKIKPPIFTQIEGFESNYILLEFIALQSLRAFRILT